MREHPLIFIGDSILSIQADRKSQARRLLKPQPPAGYELVGRVTGSTSPKNVGRFLFEDPSHSELLGFYSQRLPEVGDHLWVRETWAEVSDVCYDGDDCRGCIGCRTYRRVVVDGQARWLEYRADTGNPYPGEWPEECKDDPLCGRWKPNIHMPRWAARIVLDVTDARVQRLQDISVDDVLAEGVAFEQLNPLDHGHLSPCDEIRALQAFEDLWDRTYGNKAPWSDKPCLAIH